MDDSVIGNFRDKVNSKGFAYFWYCARDNRNLWNCICSAMDWITVAVEHINSVNLEQAGNMSSMDVFTYISSVDLIVESVQQLHRVISAEAPFPFMNNSDIFSDNQFKQNDLCYFKTLRACFGAHPVNLNEPGQEPSRSLRRFASWSSAGWKTGSASVILYSNRIDEKDIFLSVDLSRVLQFGEKYYKYLKDLGKSIEHQYEGFAALKRKEIIPSSKDPIEHLDILLEASKQRLDNKFLESEIQELKILFCTEVTDESNAVLVAAYRQDLCLLIDEIHDYLQNMNMVDLKHDNLLYTSPTTLPNGWGYWYEKISEYIFGGGYLPQLWESQITNFIKPYVNLVYNSYEELFLLLQATLYHLEKQ